MSGPEPEILVDELGDVVDAAGQKGGALADAVAIVAEVGVPTCGLAVAVAELMGIGEAKLDCAWTPFVEVCRVVMATGAFVATPVVAMSKR